MEYASEVHSERMVKSPYFNKIVEAIQEMDEIYGPSVEEYTLILDAVINECQVRKRNSNNFALKGILDNIKDMREGNFSISQLNCNLLRLQERITYC